MDKVFNWEITQPVPTTLSNLVAEWRVGYSLCAKIRNGCGWHGSAGIFVFVDLLYALYGTFWGKLAHRNLGLCTFIVPLGNYPMDF